MAKPISKLFSNKILHMAFPNRGSKPGSPSSSSGNKARGFDQVFRHLDADGDGKISIEELRSFMSTGEALSVEEAEKAIAGVDSDGDGLLDYMEFMSLMETGGGGGGGGDDDDLRRAFEMFEPEKESGCITPRSLQRVLGRLGDVRSYKECKSMIRAYDLDGDGVLDYDEFHRMMA